MIIVTSPSKPLQYNTKGLLRRGTILEDYHEEIESLYGEVEGSTKTDIPSPSAWDPETTLMFVRAVVASTLKHTFPDDGDIFWNGGDRCASILCDDSHRGCHTHIFSPAHIACKRHGYGIPS